jgi:nicotinamidase-related amidase
MAVVAGTNPYPWPFDGGLAGDRLALVVTGAQGAFADVVADASTVLERIDTAATAVRAAGGTVVWVRHGSRRRPAALLPPTGCPAWALCADPADDDVIVDAAGWDGCFGSALEADLAAIGTRYVVVAGLASELTVDTTVRTLNDRGHECLVLTDACAPVDRGLGRRAFASLTMSGGIFGALGTTTELLAALAALAPTADHAAALKESA